MPRMPVTKKAAVILVFACCGLVRALEPNEILIIANSDIGESVRLARYYCARRNVPIENILALPLGAGLGETINRSDYERRLAGPIRGKLSGGEFAGKIKCLVTTFGVPVKVGPRGALKGYENKLRELQELAEQERAKLEKLKQDADSAGGQVAAAKKKRIEVRLARLQSSIDYITGRETDASVDSELSMVLVGDYELYRWQPNKLKSGGLFFSFGTLMVSRLDGPDFRIGRRLVDKALIAEAFGLKGVAYIDSRGLADDKKRYSMGYFDQSLRDLAVLIQLRSSFAVVQERTAKLFEVDACPKTAIYCGWYNLGSYIDSFDFVDGAIGYHISSLGAVGLRDPNSSQWCPRMLADGITATFGAVAEPYLHSIPEPKEFFLELFNGRCLVEAYYRTKPFNSWQLVLIGDPLYRPFKGPIGKD